MKLLQKRKLVRLGLYIHCKVMFLTRESKRKDL